MMCSLCFSAKANPDWKLPPDEATAKANAQKLVEWCREHNNGKLVTSSTNPTSDDRKKHHYFLKNQRMAKKGAKGRTAHPAAWAVLDEAFPGWLKGSQGGCNPCSPDACVGGWCLRLTWAVFLNPGRAPAAVGVTLEHLEDGNAPAMQVS